MTESNERSQKSGRSVAHVRVAHVRVIHCARDSFPSALRECVSAQISIRPTCARVVAATAAVHSRSRVSRRQTETNDEIEKPLADGIAKIPSVAMNKHFTSYDY